MPEIHVPFVKGLHEETEKRLLPQGHLVRAENMRIEKEGRVIQRNGYEFQDGAETTPAIASAGYEAKRTLHFRDRVDVETPAELWLRQPDATYTTPVNGSAVGMFETPTRTVATPTVRYSPVASDIVYVSGFIFVVYNDFDSIGVSGTPSFDGALKYCVYERQSMRQVDSGTIVDFGVAASGTFNPKCVASGSNVMILWTQDGSVLLYVYNITTLTGAAVTLTPLISAPTIGGRQASFDLCTSSLSNTCNLILEFGAGSAVIVHYTITTAGVASLVASHSGFGTDPKQVGTCRIAGNIAIGAVTSTGNVLAGYFTAAGATIDAVATIDNDGIASGAPVFLGHSTGNYYVAWARHGSPAGAMGCYVRGGSLPTEFVQGLFPIAKPFEDADAGVLVWCVDQTHDSFGDLITDTGDYGTYRLVDIGSIAEGAVSPNEGRSVSEAVCAQEQAVAGNWYKSAFYDQRRSVITFSTADESLATFNSYMVALPTLLGTAITATRIDFVETRLGDYTDRLYSAKLNGQLFVSGGRLREYDGSQFYESGLYQGPKEFTVESISGDGEFPPGDYQYMCMWKWVDAGGRIHRSAFSVPLTVEGSGENTAHELKIAVPHFSGRLAAGTVTISVEIYRTLVDQSIFHLLNPNERIVIDPDLSIGFVTFTDIATDESIEANEGPYIGPNGEVLDHDEPPSCKYIWAGEDRLIMGGLEVPSMYQLSRKARPGYAVAFSSDEVFRGTIEGVVTGVAQLDGTWFVSSSDNLWAVVGDGPDEGGQGNFSRPRKLPSDTGFKSQRSVVEVPQGLLFQGRGDKMYLLPRGGASPTWIGRMVQDTLEEFPFISCAMYLPEEHLAVFACWRFPEDEDDGDGRLLIFDTDAGEWMTDKLFGTEDESTRQFRSICPWGGKVLLDGAIQGTDESTDDHDGVSPGFIVEVLETGDMRYFGPGGLGRCRKATLLGEAIAEFVEVRVEVSRDSGATYDTPNGLFAPPDQPSFTDYLDYSLPWVRGSTFRYRITVTSCDDAGVPTIGAGAALNSMSFEVFPSKGLVNVGVEKRA